MKLRLHVTGTRHNKIRTIARVIVRDFEGDARMLWRTESKALPADEVLKQLLKLGAGPQVSRMIVGALYDTGQIGSAGQPKADVHVRRTLGRIFDGEQASVDRVHELALKVSPELPWIIDAPLYRLGQRLCKKNTQTCNSCDFCSFCKWHQSGKSREP